MGHIKNAAFALLAFSALGATAPASAATLIGDTVTTQLRISGSNLGTVTAVVGAGEEGNFFGNQFFNYGANTFAIRSTSAFSSFNGGGAVQLILSSLDFGTPITGVTFSTLLTGVTSSFTANSVTFSFADQPLFATTYLSATIQSAVAPVPEPATWAMMILGMGAVGFAMRRRQKGNVTTTVAYA
jgi:hypothetical protein